MHKAKAHIFFHSDGISYTLKHKTLIREWVIKIIYSEKGKPGEINFIFCSDKCLHKINLAYLKHDTYTDIISFDYSAQELLSGDIFISIDRVKENAKKFNADFTEELHRVMIHGILHLLGYKDKTRSQKATMQGKEDFCLSLLSLNK